MEYMTKCNNCGQTYVVCGSPGQTIKSICPYCGAKATVVTPGEDVVQGTPDTSQPSSATLPNRGHASKPLFWKVTLWFLVIVTILFVVLTILYFVFSSVSK